MAGMEIPSDREMDGVDLSEVLFEKKPSPRETVFYYRGPELYAVRLGGYKAHFITEGGYGDEPKTVHETPLLYNVDADPSEAYEISGKHPEVIEKINEVVKEHNAKMVKGPNQLKDLERPMNGE